MASSGSTNRRSPKARAIPKAPSSNDRTPVVPQPSRSTKPSSSSSSGSGFSERVFRFPDGSRTDSSPWVWRAMFLLAVIAFGFCLTFAIGQRAVLALAWAVIALGWFGISMWLWRRHHNWVLSTED